MADREEKERETKDDIITIMEIEDMYMAIQGPELSIRIVVLIHVFSILYVQTSMILGSALMCNMYV